MHECNVPEELLYDIQRHVWMKKDGELWVVGMTDAAQALAGLLAKITPKPVGTFVKEGKALAIVESGKWVGPFPAPFSCMIVQINEAVKDYPGVRMVNKDPYGAGWIMKVQALEDAKGEGAEKYREQLKKEGIECKKE